MTKKYGEEEGIKRFNEYCEKQRYTNSEEYFIERFGIEEGKKRYLEYNISKAVTIENMIKKYGEEEGIKRYEDKCIRQGYFQSKIANELFTEIYRGDNNVYFEALNKEFGIMNKKIKKYFFYDYIDVERKKCIEFNGDVFHANPKKYKFDDTPLFWLNDKKSFQIWEEVKIKIDTIIKIGYNVLIVWEDDYRNNKLETIKKCESFLYGD